MFQVLVWLTFIYNILSYIFSQVSSERDSDNNSNSPKPKKKRDVTPDGNSSQLKKKSDGKGADPKEEDDESTSKRKKSGKGAARKKENITSDENSSKPKKKSDKKRKGDVQKDDNNSTQECDVPMRDVTSDDNNSNSGAEPRRDVTSNDQPPEKRKRDVPQGNGNSSDELIIVKKKTVQASLRRSVRVQQRREKVQAICKKAKKDYSKRLAATFILGESSVTYRPPAGYYGSFGVKEINVHGQSEDGEDDVDEDTESSTGPKEVVLKKPKKGFLDNEVIFSDDDDTEIDNTLKNNIGKDLKVQVEDLNVSKILDSSDKEEIFEIAEKKTVDSISSQYPTRFVRPKHDVQDSECDVNSDSKRDVQDSKCDVVNSDSKRDVNSDSEGHVQDSNVQDVNSDSECDIQEFVSPPPMYMGDIKVNTRVLAEEEKYCENPGWRKGISVPVDSRGRGEHQTIISHMEQGGEKDRKLLEFLNALTEYESEPEKLVEDETADESENAPKSEEEDKQDSVDKSHSLELESAPDSHTKTDGYGNSNEESVPVEENIKRDGLVEKSDGTEKNGDRNEDEENIKHDGLVGKCDGTEKNGDRNEDEENIECDGLVGKHDGTEKNGDRNEDEENLERDGLVGKHDGTEKNGDRRCISINEDEENIERDGLVGKREHNGDGMGTGTIIIKPSQGNEECNYSHQERDQNLVYDFETGKAYDIGDIDFSSFSQLYLIDAVATETGLQPTVTELTITDAPSGSADIDKNSSVPQDETHVLKLVVEKITDNELDIKKEHDDTVDEELKLKERDRDVKPETDNEKPPLKLESKSEAESDTETDSDGNTEIAVEPPVEVKERDGQTDEQAVELKECDGQPPVEVKERDGQTPAVEVKERDGQRPAVEPPVEVKERDGQTPVVEVKERDGQCPAVEPPVEEHDGQTDGQAVEVKERDGQRPKKQIYSLRDADDEGSSSENVERKKKNHFTTHQFYRRRVTRKQQDSSTGNQSPDECTVKIGRRCIYITDKVTKNRSEIRQVYSCRLAMQFKSRNKNMRRDIAKIKEVSTHADTSSSQTEYCYQRW